MELTREEIASWCLSNDFSMDEKTILKLGFHKYAHVTRSYFGYPEAFNIYRRILYETDIVMLDMRYCFYDGYASLFYTNKLDKSVGLCYEQFGTAFGRGFKLFLRHRALKYIDLVKKEHKTKLRCKLWFFDSDKIKITYF